MLENKIKIGIIDYECGNILSVKRSIESKIKDLMKKYPAVVLIGARQVGKSTILKKNRSKS